MKWDNGHRTSCWAKWHSAWVQTEWGISFTRVLGRQRLPLWVSLRGGWQREASVEQGTLKSSYLQGRDRRRCKICTIYMHSEQKMFRSIFLLNILKRLIRILLDWLDAWNIVGFYYPTAISSCSGQICIRILEFTWPNASNFLRFRPHVGSSVYTVMEVCARKITQGSGCLHEADDAKLIPGFHRVEGGNWLLSVVSGFYIYVITCVFPPKKYRERKA